MHAACVCKCKSVYIRIYMKFKGIFKGSPRLDVIPQAPRVQRCFLLWPLAIAEVRMWTFAGADSSWELSNPRAQSMAQLRNTSKILKNHIRDPCMS